MMRPITPQEGLNCQYLQQKGIDYVLLQVSDCGKKKKILDATRSQMQRGLRRTGRITLNLNKQVAYMGKISFCEGKVILGTIKVIIETDEPDALIDTIAPETVDGEEVLL